MSAALVTLLLALTAPVESSAQDSARVWATLSSEAIELGETVVLRLNIETDGPAPERIVAPSLPGEIDVVGTSDQSQMRFSMPGGRTRLLRRELILRPTTSGTYRIEPFSVTVKGRTYHTSQLTLTVSNANPAGAAPGGGARSGGGGVAGWTPGSSGDLSRGPDDEVLFSSAFSADTVYVGEQVTLRSDIMVSEQAQFRLRRAPEYMPPDGPGFWVRDLPDGGRATPRHVDGVLYFGRTLERAYFPLAPGNYTLEPSRLRYEIRRGILYSPQTQELSSDSLRLVVLPVPEAGRPDGFTGAVGRFQIRARLEPNEVPAGEAVALTVEVEGEGNIKAIPPPTLPDLPDIEVFAPSESAEVRTTGGRVSGVKRFTWVLVPREAGRITLPAIEYPYFDPERRTFATARSAELSLAVRGAPAPHGEATDVEEIRPIEPEPSTSRPLRWVRTPWFGAAQLLPLFGVIGVLLGRRRRGSRLPSRRTLRNRLRVDLDNLQRHAAGDAAAFCRDLERIVRSWLAERLAEPSIRTTAPSHVRTLLRAAGVNQAAAEEVERLIDRLAAGRFSPTPPGAAERVAMAEDAERILGIVDREARSSRPAPSAGHLSVALVLALPALGQAQGPEAVFRQGTERFADGDFLTAANDFTEYVRLRPEEPHGWYNLGNAYYMADEKGRAVWAWLQALKRSPRDPDVLHNLGVAGAEPWLVRRARPIPPLRGEELALFASLAWWVGVGTAMRSIRRRRTALGAYLGLALTAALVGSWGASHARAATGVVLARETHLQAAPSVRAESLRTLDGATGLRIVDRRGDWLRVRLGDGTEGWIESVDVGEL